MCYIFQCFDNHVWDQVPEDKPVEALALFKRATFPSSEGVVWNPKASMPLQITSTTHVVVGEMEATLGPAMFPAQPAKELVVHRGEKLRIQIAVAGGYSDEENAPQLYIFVWSKDGLPINAAGSSSLDIASMDDCDGGVYTCTVSTLDGEVVTSEPLSVIAGLTRNDTRMSGDVGNDSATAFAALLPAGAGLFVGLVVGCVVGQRKGAKATEAALKGYRVMPTEEE